MTAKENFSAGTQTKANIPIASMVSAIPPPQGTGWMPVASVPLSVMSAPWSPMKAVIGPVHVTFYYRIVVVSGVTYLQIWNNRYESYAARAFSVTVGGVPAGVGAITDASLQSAAQALLTHLQASGCQQTADSVVSAFQTAYNTAGAGTALTVDGLYGAGTAAALQAVLSAGSGGTAPAGCVATASSTAPSTAITPASGGLTGAPMTTGTTLLIGAGVLSVGLISYALYRRHQRA
jgi:hypothetical protein